jgi:hypothetical protein
MVLKEIYALLMRGPMFRVMVQDEVLTIIGEHGDRAHAYVVEKLRRTDLTSRYRVMLRAVERQLRTRPGHRDAAGQFART